MKRILLFLLVLTSLPILAQETGLTGVFKGHSLYIQNSYNKDSGEFCINEIYVNEKSVNLNLKLSALKVNFERVELFSPVSVKVIHKVYCSPKIVNPEAVLYHSSFKFDSLFLNDSLLTWHSKGDRRNGVFKIERLDDEYWETLTRIRAKGYFDGAQYVYFPEHKAEGNIYRIKYELPNGRYLYSEEMEHFQFPDDVSFSPKEVEDVITLSQKAPYIITNEYGKEIMKGNSKIIPVGMLKPGEYNIEIEGNNDTFTKL
jgi:hypothetical protein